MHKAVILAAGKGTRMRELTAEMPKPMLSVKGKPILEHIISGMKAAGITEFCIVTGWKAEVIEQHFGDGASLGISITYIRQETQDGTGSSVALAKDFVGNDPFMMSYGDILVPEETYEKIVARYDKGDVDGITSVLPSSEYNKSLGLFLFDHDFVLTHLVEKPSEEELAALKTEGYLKEDDTYWYNAGIFVFPASLFEALGKIEKSPRGEYELTDALKMIIAKGARFAGFSIEHSWADVRDPEILASLQ